MDLHFGTRPKGDVVWPRPHANIVGDALRLCSVDSRLVMIPHDPMTWAIMLGNLALLVVLYRLIRGRRTH
jgi:hypothetical protein